MNRQATNLRSAIRRRIGTRRDQGVIIPMTALALTLILTMTAFAIDLGRMRDERRNLQANADAIALDAVQVINGNNAADALPLVLTEANASAARNGMDVTLTSNEVQVGSWDVPTQTFTPMTGTDEYPDAVRVQLSGLVPMYFDLSSDDRPVSRESVAVDRAYARAELGSVFAGIQTYDPTADCSVNAALDAQMTFMNHLYTQYFGISVSGGIGASGSGYVPCDVTGPSDGLKLDALSWQGLAFGQVDLGDVASRMGFASADDLVNSTVSAGDLLDAAASSMQASGNATDVNAGTILGSFSSHVASDAQLAVSDIFGLDAGNPSAGAADVWVNALDLVGMSAMAIDGNNFAAVDLPVSLGNADPIVTPRISIIEPPKADVQFMRPGQAGPHTAQVKIGFDFPLTNVPVDLGVLGGVLGSLGVQTSDGNFSLVVEAARADSTYGDISCPVVGDPTAALEAETGAFSVSLGTVTDSMLRKEEPWNLKAQSMLTASIGIPITGPSIDLAAVTDVDYSETYALGASAVGRFDGNFNAFGATESHTFTGPFDPNDPGPFYRYDGGLSGTSITDDTYAHVDYNTTSSMLSTLGVADAAVHNLVQAAMAPVEQEIAQEVIDPLLSALGITVAGADGRILDVNCQVPALANRG